VVPLHQEGPPYWRWNLPLRQAVLGMQQLTPRTARDVADFLDRRGFELWTGYPSVVHAFALSALERGVELQRPPRVIALGAEPVGELQRRDLEQLTGATVTDQYGLSEGCGNLSQCPAGRYHEDFEFGLVECVDPEPLDGGRTRGHIVCTGFACPEAPLIRYDTGDVGVWFDAEDRCPCGRQSRTLESIEGRLEDYVLTPEGRRIMRFDYVFKEAAAVKEAQVVQDRAGAVTLRIVPRDGFGPEDERFLRGEVAHWISESLQVELELVDAIAREPNGKFRAVVSRLGLQGAGIIGP
jgi:phenylacetate-CoA ligase